MTTFELLCKEFGSDTGVFFPTFQAALAEVTDGDEIWQVADDVPRTRVLRVWPVRELAIADAFTPPDPFSRKV